VEKTKEAPKTRKKAIPWGNVPRVADVVPALEQFGEYKKLSEIVDQPVLVYLTDEWRGQGDPTMGSGPSILLACQAVNSDKFWMIVSHDVLFQKLSHVTDKLPVVATFFMPKGKRYYDVR